MNNNGRKRVRRARKNESIKRILLTVCMMAMIAAVSIGGTLAWLTDKTSEVKNVFTPTNIDIELNETKSDFVMIPGRVIDKDPTITINGESESLWLFVKVEESENYDDFLTYAMADVWTQVTGTENVFYYKVSSPKDVPSVAVLKDNKVTVNTGVTKAMMDELYDDSSKYPELTITAYAIQTEYLGTDDAAKAWEMLNTQGFDDYTDPNKLPFGTQTTTTGGEEDNGEG